MDTSDNRSRQMCLPEISLAGRSLYIHSSVMSLEKEGGLETENRRVLESSQRKHLETSGNVKKYMNTWTFTEKMETSEKLKCSAISRVRTLATVLRHKTCIPLFFWYFHSIHSILPGHLRPSPFVPRHDLPMPWMWYGQGASVCKRFSTSPRMKTKVAIELIPKCND